MQTWIGVTMAVVVFSLGGCGGKKDDECKAMIPVATKDIEALKASAAAAAAKSGAGAKELSAAVVLVAESAEKLAGDISKKGPTTAELQKASSDYQAMAKAIAAAALDDADSLDRIAALEPKVRPDIADADRKTVTASQEKVKQRCTEHPAPECKAIASLSSTLTPTSIPEQLDKVEADLGKIRGRDVALGPLVTTLRGALTGLARTLRDATDAAVELKAAQAKRITTKAAVDAALAKEAGITASLAAFCSK